jgi:hypothetical protein
LTIVRAGTPAGDRVEALYLNGEKVEDALAFDMEAGWVDVLARDENGDFVDADPCPHCYAESLKIERRRGTIGVQYAGHRGRVEGSGVDNGTGSE